MFRKRTYNREFLAQWNERMSHPNVEPLYDSVVVSILKQQNVDIEYIPRNLYQPEALYDALEHYDPEFAFVCDFQDPDVVAGRNFSFRCFSKPSWIAPLEPVRLDAPSSEVFKLLNINGKASAGLTAYGLTKFEAFSVAMRKLPEVLGGKAPDPCLAGLRTQFGKLGRLVWMYPFVMTLIEGCVARPIIRHFLGEPTTIMAFGQRSAKMGMDIRRAIAHNGYYVSMDASKFDSSISAGMIRCAFAAFRTWFNPEDEVGFGATVADVFNIIEDYFINTPIVMPAVGGPKLYTGKRHGVPSGSYFTQLVDSFVNAAMIGTLSFHYHLSVRSDEAWVLGDDMLFFTRKAPNLDAYAELLSRKFGMRVNAEKSAAGKSSDSFHFLGRAWNNGLPTWEFSDVVQRAVAPERFRKYFDKDKEARAVLWSYRNSGFILNAPRDFYFQVPYLPSRARVHRSGLSEFYEREGLVPLRMSETLF